MKLQLSTAILSSLTLTAVTAQCPVKDCWCVPDDPTDTVCPPIGNRINVDDDAKADPVKAFLESITPSDDDGDSFKLYPEGCEPFPIVAAYFEKDVCEGVVGQSENADGCCAFDFSDDVCDGGTYGLYIEDDETQDDERMLKKGKKRKGQGQKKGKKNKKTEATGGEGGLITHEGACGVCSSAQDAVALMNPNMKPEHEACAREMTASLIDTALLPDLLPNFIECHKAMGFSDGCSALWASQWFAATLEAMAAYEAGDTYNGPDACKECGDACFGTNFTSPVCFTTFDETTCMPGLCVQCEAIQVQPTFSRFAGRTRRSSGVVAVDTKYKCSETTADIVQPDVCPI